MDLLQRALQITGIGMGLTFGAIGVLVGAMVLLTHWVREAPASKSAPSLDGLSGAIPPSESLAECELAAAVAVSVALAQAARRAHPTHAWHATSPKEGLSPWQAYFRGQQLEQQKTHQTLRW